MRGSQGVQKCTQVNEILWAGGKQWQFLQISGKLQLGIFYLCPVN